MSLIGVTGLQAVAWSVRVILQYFDMVLLVGCYFFNMKLVWVLHLNAAALL